MDPTEIQRGGASEFTVGFSLGLKNRERRIWLPEGFRG